MLSVQTETLPTTSSHLFHIKSILFSHISELCVNLNRKPNTQLPVLVYYHFPGFCTTVRLKSKIYNARVLSGQQIHLVPTSFATGDLCICKFSIYCVVSLRKLNDASYVASNGMLMYFRSRERRVLA